MARHREDCSATLVPAFLIETQVRTTPRDTRGFLRAKAFDRRGRGEMPPRNAEPEKSPGVKTEILGALITCQQARSFQTFLHAEISDHNADDPSGFYG